MNETPQQYIQRLFSLVGSADPREILATTAGKLRRLVEGRPLAELGRKPEPHRWSATQILAHLADSEIVGAWRLRAILGNNGAELQAYDQDRWAAAFRYEAADPFESLQLFAANRDGTLTLLRRVDPALLENYGMHAERGRESIAHLVRLYAGHDLNHLQQIERLLK